jgi:hypothetical protein
MAKELRQSVAHLEGTMTAGLAVLCTASGYWTYMGVRGLLDGDGILPVGGAIIYSVAVAVGIFVFWSYMLRFMPLFGRGRARGGLWIALILGCGAIMAMSSWLNAAALAGSGAVEQHLALTVEEYQRRLEQAHENALAAQSLVPDLEREAERFRQLSDKERESGALTGTSGQGTVVELLAQKSAELRTLADQIRDSREALDRLYALGGQKLGTLREIVSASGDIADRSVVFAKEAVALVGIIADLQQSSLAQSVKRAALDLAESFIAPSPSGGTSALGIAQNDVIQEIEAAIATTSQRLAQAAEEILERPKAEPFRFVPLAAAEAVLRYASEFIPSWAGAIAIDLMPGVLVLILMVVQGAIREREGGSDQVLQVTMGDMAAALAAQERLDELRARARKRAEEAERAEAAAASPPPKPAGEPEVTLAYDAAAGRRPRPSDGR